MSLASLANDPELQKFVAEKELENQLTAQVDYQQIRDMSSASLSISRFII